MGCSPEKVENPVASRSPDRHRWQAPPDPRLKPRKNTHFHLLKDACYTLRMEQPRPLDGSKVQTLAFIIEVIFRRAPRRSPPYGGTGPGADGCWPRPPSAIA